MMFFRWGCFLYVTAFVNHAWLSEPVPLGSDKNVKCYMIVVRIGRLCTKATRNFDTRLVMTSNTPLTCFPENLFLLSARGITYDTLYVSPPSLSTIVLFLRTGFVYIMYRFVYREPWEHFYWNPSSLLLQSSRWEAYVVMPCPMHR